ncbi:Hpt domain-containing protein [Xanthomonadaceae bacterium JHOS43]|nr:Hpt domain-containing protein [Xanthomonadaceae bacterium JHOS43]MCX7562448.1 Hpt domain-containing protein [Xanthomonadaceae bacterium XH05]
MTGLDELHRQYRQSLTTKRDDLRRAWDRLCDEEATPAHVAQLHLLLHRLAGSAGTYGYADIATRAKAVEQGWTEWMAQAPEVRPQPYRVCAAQAALMAGLLDAMQVQ